MAVAEFFKDDPTLKWYIGTTAEREAMSTSAVVVGSTFYETDSFKMYIWDGSAWKRWFPCSQ